MVHRLDIDRAALPKIVFQGVLDGAALFEIRRHLAALSAAGDGSRVRLVLKAGTEVEPGLLDQLRGLPAAELEAESPFLARLLRTGRNDR